MIVCNFGLIAVLCLSSRMIKHDCVQLRFRVGSFLCCFMFESIVLVILDEL